jgi:hypothetical protein
MRIFSRLAGGRRDASRSSACQVVPKRSACVMALLFLGAAPGAVLADGWHNATLGSGSIDDWLRDVQTAVPGFAANLTSSRSPTGVAQGNKPNKPPQGSEKPGPAPGDADYRPGGVPPNLTAQQQSVLERKARDCLEVLAYMDPKNIYPREFPDFPLEKIPEYRQTAKQLLGLMGPTGTAAVVNQVRAELMNPALLNPRLARLRQKPPDVQPRPDYYFELLQLLRDAAQGGQLTQQDEQALLEASSGVKIGAQALFAQHVAEVLTSLQDSRAKSLGLPALLQLVQTTVDTNRKRALQGQLYQRVGTAPVKELLALAQVRDAPSSLRNTVGNQLQKRVPALTTAELLAVLCANVQPSVRHAALKEVEGRKPALPELRDQLPAIAEFLEATEPKAAELARAQIAGALEHASLSDSLYWLGQGQERLNRLVWQEIDRRLQGADEARAASSASTGIGVLGNPNASLPCRLAAVDLLRRLQRKDVVGTMVELLSTLPPELWPPTGQLLRDLTGRDYGPKQGDGAEEVATAVEKWRAWVSEQETPANKDTKSP